MHFSELNPTNLTIGLISSLGLEKISLPLIPLSDCRSPTVTCWTPAFPNVVEFLVLSLVVTGHTKLDLKYF